MKAMEARERPHFVIVSNPAQGHINPALHLAKRLLEVAGDGDGGGATVTFSTTISAHRRMFRMSIPNEEEVVEKGSITFFPFTTGDDDQLGLMYEHFAPEFRISVSRNLSDMLTKLADGGRQRPPVTCIFFTVYLPWSINHFRQEHPNPPLVLYWIQSASAFSYHFHYFHGYDSIVAPLVDDPKHQVTVPGLPPLPAADLPGLHLFPPGNPWFAAIISLREKFEDLDKFKVVGDRPTVVLINTFEALESEALHATAAAGITPVTVNRPSLTTSSTNFKLDVFETDLDQNYLEWLDSKPDGSVIYVSFGSVLPVSKKQVEEMAKALKEISRPFLWSLRKNHKEALELNIHGGEGLGLGLVVEWCEQRSVLNHAAVGCFVSHCGWNSTVESLEYGVPVVGVPGWSDQRTNAAMLELSWGTGILVPVNSDGVYEAAEVKRCVDVVMGGGESISPMRKKAMTWKVKLAEALDGHGLHGRRRFHPPALLDRNVFFCRI